MTENDTTECHMIFENVLYDVKGLAVTVSGVLIQVCDDGKRQKRVKHILFIYLFLVGVC